MAEIQVGDTFGGGQRQGRDFGHEFIQIFAKVGFLLVFTKLDHIGQLDFSRCFQHGLLGVVQPVVVAGQSVEAATQRVKLVSQGVGRVRLHQHHVQAGTQANLRAIGIAETTQQMVVV